MGLRKEKFEEYQRVNSNFKTRAIDYLKIKTVQAPKTLLEKFKIIKKNIGIEDEVDDDPFTHAP
jgi:hypothetical protein